MGGKGGGPIRHRLTIAAVLFLLLCAWTAADPAGFTLAYTLEVADPVSQNVVVTIGFRGYPDTAARLHFHPYYPKDTPVVLSSFSASAPDGTPLPTREEDGLRVVANGRNRDFTVRYVFPMNQYRGSPDAPYGYLCGTYLLTCSAWIFMAPEGARAESYRVRFRLPSGWTAACPWKESGDSFEETDFWNFYQATIGCGDLEIRRRKIGGTDVRIALDRSFDEGYRERIFADCFTLFAFVKDQFAAATPASHLSVLVKQGSPREWQWTNEACYSQGEAVAGMDSVVYQYTHRIVHTFNAFYPNGMNFRPVWFREGADEYACILGRMAIHETFPLGPAIDTYGNVYLAGRPGLDGPLFQEGVPDAEGERATYLYYKKGALVCLLLDREIRGASGGRKSLADLLAALYAGYGNHWERTISEETLERFASACAGRDLSPFFSSYVRGNAPLNLEPLFADTDGDGICLAAEEMSGTDPASADSDGDGASDLVEYFEGTDPLRAASNPGRSLYVDGRAADWPAEGSLDFPQERGNAPPALDLVCVRFLRRDGALYALLETAAPADRVRPLRYYLNVDLDGDSIGELHFAAVYRSRGDTSRFRKDWTSYDWRGMQDVPGLESALNACAEFRIPLSFLPDGRKIRVSAGIWDSATGNGIDGTPWMEVGP